MQSAASGLLGRAVNTRRLFRKPMKELMTADETAIYIRHAKQTLSKWRCYGEGPRWVKIGRAALYDHCDVDAWIDERARRSTSEGN